MLQEDKILQILVEMQGDLKNVKTEVQDVKAELQNVKTEMREGFERVDKQFEQVDERFGEIEDRLHCIEVQQRENTDVIQAIRHNQEHMGAEVEALKTYTASAESVERLAVQFSILNERQFQQETELRRIK